MAKNDNKKPFFKRKLVWLVVIIVIIAIAASAGGDKTKNSNTSNKSNTTQTKAWDADTAYAQIQKGMSQEQVDAIVGFAPTTTSESETEGLGKMVMASYAKGFSGTSISVTYLNGEVYNKNIVKL